MFAGHYIHTIDAKRRLMIPARFRDILARETDRSLYATVDIFRNERFLGIFPSTAWAARVKRNEDLERQGADLELYARQFFWNAEIVVPDKQCRLMMPERLLGEAGLGRSAVLLGQGDHMEVWDEARWRSLSDKASAMLGKLRSQTYGRPDLNVQVREE